MLSLVDINYFTENNIKINIIHIKFHYNFKWTYLKLNLVNILVLSTGNVKWGWIR